MKYQAKPDYHDGRSVVAGSQEKGTEDLRNSLFGIPYYDCGDVFTTEHICPTHATIHLTSVNFIFCKLYLKKSEYFK